MLFAPAPLLAIVPVQGYALGFPKTPQNGSHRSLPGPGTRATGAPYPVTAECE